MGKDEQGNNIPGATPVPGSNQYDAEVTISGNVAQRELDRDNSRMVDKSRPAVILHELNESYDRTTNKKNYGEAHNAAVQTTLSIPVGDRRRDLEPGRSRGTRKL